MYAIRSYYVTLRREAWTLPDAVDYLEGDPLVPLRAGGQVAWQLD